MKPISRYPRRTFRLPVVAGAAFLVAGCTNSSGPKQSASATATSQLAASSAALSSSPSGSSSASAASSAPGSTHPTAIWPTYHHDATRNGNAGAVPAVTTLRVTATASLDGALYASPLVLHDATGDLVIAATENNTLYGLRNDGSAAWQRHIGSPVSGSSLPCGNIDPTGITGTPAYDPATGLVFAVAFVSDTKHVLVAVDAETGALAWTRPIDPPGSHPEVEQERGALLVSGGKVWIPFGGLEGDCGPYHGYLVGVDTSRPQTPVLNYQVPSSREAGIWTPTGAAADSAGHVYLAVGNGAQTNPQGAYDMSDSVIELQGTSVVSFFAPATWADENAADLDLGTTGPLILPGGQVFVAGKNGNAYLLKQGALGGVGGAVPSIRLCKAFGGAAYADGVIFVPCTDGLHAVRVGANSLTATWQAAPPGSPVIGGGAILSTDQNVLYALDPATGSTKAKVDLGDGTTRFATPSISNDGHVYVGTQHGKLVVLATS